MAFDLNGTIGPKSCMEKSIMTGNHRWCRGTDAELPRACRGAYPGPDHHRSREVHRELPRLDYRYA